MSQNGQPEAGGGQLGAHLPINRETDRRGNGAFPPSGYHRAVKKAHILLGKKSTEKDRHLPFTFFYLTP
jgi:hypothetical protein